MTKLLTAAQMRAIEQAAIASGEVTGLELMERAGRGVVEAIFEEWPEMRSTPHRAVVLCGPGNNGGDGFVVARLLKEWGWEVEVWFAGEIDRLPPDAAHTCAQWRQAGGAIHVFSGRMAKPRLLPSEPWREDLANGHCFIIDAVFGTGLSRLIDLDSPFAAMFGAHFEEAMIEEDVEVHRVAIDVPSGLCADSGRILSQHGKANARARFSADLTVATGFFKLGHFMDEGPNSCGKVVRADLGSLGHPGIGHPGCRDPTKDSPRLVTEDRIRAGRAFHGWMGYHFLGKGLKGRDQSHKYTHGHALILSGPPGHTGAARLAARGALRIGAGLVTVGAEAQAIPEHAAQLNAIMLREVSDGTTLTDALSDPRINALCLGPGLGLCERARVLVAAALGLERDPAPGLTRGLVGGEAHGGQRGPGSSPGRGGKARRIVLDADALTLIARDPALFAALNENCILTPHAGEFARLFPDIAEKLAAPATKGPAYSKVDATREAAKRAGCVILYKGPDTVIADPSGQCRINSAHYDRAAPWLATAGSGDVLAGFIAGLMARGFAPMQAAETAAWLHVECALKFGPGLIAEDLPEQLPAVFRDLGL